MSNENKTMFSKKDTAAVKGLAVCLLLIHHLYMGVLPAPMSFFGNSPLTVFATLSKVCVAVFALLSGYGVAISFRNRKEDVSVIAFQKKHLLGLLKPYWLVYAVFFILSAFFAREEFSIAACYGTGVKGFFSALAEIFALRPLFGTGTLNQTWWYMEAALVLYLLFPLFYRLCEKVPYLLLPVTALPLIFYTIFGNNVWDTCREIYWFFPFCVGIFLAQRNLLSRFCEMCEKSRAKCTAVSFLILLVCTVLRARIGLAFDTFFALSILLFMRCVFCRMPIVGGVLSFLGKYSADIFYTHSFFYCYFVTQKYFVRYFLWSENVFMLLAAFPVLLAVSLAAAMLLERMRKVLFK